MQIFESILVLLLGATFLALVAKRLRVPYPTLLALGGAALAFVPGAPKLDLPPELILTLFVAPVLLDAAYDASWRDLRKNWLPVLSLVLVAVALTTLAVALVARWLFPDMPWAAAVALGALTAPPDAVAALTVLRHVDPPYRIRTVLEGEGLLNDATALVTYRLAVSAMAAGSFQLSDALPMFALVCLGSVAMGLALAWPASRLTASVEDVPSSVILQFVFTFGVWVAAEHLGLSSVVTIVVFGLVMARQTETAAMSAHMRVPSFAIWESVTVVLNVLAFTLIGLQLRPILLALEPGERIGMFAASLLILAVTILVRMGWVLTHHGLAVGIHRVFGEQETRVSVSGPSWKSAFVVGWSGMRGIVTLAAAMALPAGFPYRDFIQLTAFVVVLGTLVLQGLTLRPLLMALHLPQDTTVEDEIGVARKAALEAALAALADDKSSAAHHLRLEYEGALKRVHGGDNPHDSRVNTLRRHAVERSRGALQHLRADGTIGDDAYRVVEEELDWIEMSARSERGRE